MNGYQGPFGVRATLYLQLVPAEYLEEAQANSKFTSEQSTLGLTLNVTRALIGEIRIRPPATTTQRKRGREVVLAPRQAVMEEETERKDSTATVAWLKEAKLRGWEIGSIVYLKWASNKAPQKRVVIGIGKIPNRNVLALYRVQQHADCPKDKQVLVVTPAKLKSYGVDKEIVPLHSHHLLEDYSLCPAHPQLPQIAQWQVVSVAPGNEEEETDEDFDDIERTPGVLQKKKSFKPSSPPSPPSPPLRALSPSPPRLFVVTPDPRVLSPLLPLLCLVPPLSNLNLCRIRLSRPE